MNSPNQVTSDVENQGVIDTRKQLLMTTNKHNDRVLNVALNNGYVNVAKFLVEEDKGLLDMANTNNNGYVERGLFEIADHILKTFPSASGKGPKDMNAPHATVIQLKSSSWDEYRSP